MQARMIKVDNLVKCSRCNNTFINEAFREHLCTTMYRDSKTIMIDWHTLTRDPEGRETILAKSMDGVLYSLIVNNRPSIPIPFVPSDESLQGNRSDGDFTEPDYDTLIYLSAPHHSNV